MESGELNPYAAPEHDAAPRAELGDTKGALEAERLQHLRAESFVRGLGLACYAGCIPAGLVAAVLWFVDTGSAGGPPWVPRVGTVIATVALLVGGGGLRSLNAMGRVGAIVAFLAWTAMLFMSEGLQNFQTPRHALRAAAWVGAVGAPTLALLHREVSRVLTHRYRHVVIPATGGLKRTRWRALPYALGVSFAVFTIMMLTAAVS